MNRSRTAAPRSAMSLALGLILAWGCGGSSSSARDSGANSDDPGDTETETSSDTDTVMDSGLPADAGADGGSSTDQPKWPISVGGHLEDDLHDLVALDDGSVVVLGAFEDEIRFERPAQRDVVLCSEGNSDLFVARYSKDARFMWARLVTSDGTMDSANLDLVGGDLLLLSGRTFGAYVTIGTGSEAVTIPAQSGESEIFLASLDTSGNTQWTRSIWSDTQWAAVPVQASIPGGEGFVLAGRFAGSIVLGEGEPEETLLSTAAIGDNEIFVATYGQDGSLGWAARLTSGYTGGTLSDVAATESGEVYVTGTYENYTTFGEGGANETEIYGALPYDAFLAMLSEGPQLQWVRDLGGTGTEDPTGLEVLPDGSCVIVGGYNDYIVLLGGTAPTTLYSAGGTDMFLARYDTAGNLMWARSAGGSSDDTPGDRPHGSRVDGDGRILLTGVFRHGATFGEESAPETITSTGEIDAFVARYLSDGTFETAWAMGGSLDDEGIAVAASGDGRFVGGTFQGAAEMGGPTEEKWLFAKGPQDIFVGRYGGE